MTRSTRALVRLDEASALDKVDASLQTWAAVNASIWDLAGAFFCFTEVFSTSNTVLGVKSIHNIYQNLAIHGDTWHTSAQLATRINISNQYTQNGEYTRALQCLFDDKLLSEINLVEYAVWADGVWAVLRRRSERLWVIYWLGHDIAQSTSRSQRWTGPLMSVSDELEFTSRIDSLIAKSVERDVGYSTWRSIKPNLTHQRETGISDLSSCCWHSRWLKIASISHSNSRPMLSCWHLKLATSMVLTF